MRLPSLLRLASAVAATISVLYASPAAAQDPPEKAVAEAGPRFRPLSVTVNPLGVVILGRYGANVEYLVAKHHGLWVYPFYTSFSFETSIGTSTTKSETTGFGGELGYHFYSGEKGANGFYVGPTAGAFKLNTSRTCSISTSCGGDTSSTATHVGIDLGGQHVFDNGFTIGGGGGLMRFLGSSSTNSDSSLTKYSGTLPRFLFTIGYSF